MNEANHQGHEAVIDGDAPAAADAPSVRANIATAARGTFLLLLLLLLMSWGIKIGNTPDPQPMPTSGKIYS